MSAVISKLAKKSQQQIASSVSFTCTTAGDQSTPLSFSKYMCRQQIACFFLRRLNIVLPTLLRPFVQFVKLRNTLIYLPCTYFRFLYFQTYTNKCSLKGCKVKELVPCICQKCRLNFCLKHRHSQDHYCVGADEARRQRAL